MKTELIELSEAYYRFVDHFEENGMLITKNRPEFKHCNKILFLETKDGIPTGKCHERYVKGWLFKDEGLVEGYCALLLRRRLPYREPEIISKLIDTEYEDENKFEK